MRATTTFAILAAVCLQAGWMAASAAASEAKEPDCPVCHNVLTKFTETLTKEDKKDIVTIEEKFQKFCDKKANDGGKDSKFCYYTTGASSLKREISKPIQSGFPMAAICKKLGKRDTAICELEYRKTYTHDLTKLTEPEITKMRLKDLRVILQEYNKECVGCLEKSDFVTTILKVQADLPAPKAEL